MILYNIYKNKRLSFIVVCIIVLIALGIPVSSAHIQDDQKDRLYLVNADKINYDQYEHPGAQFLVGKVHFRHGGMNMWADSAIYYQDANIFEAYGHVKAIQGDTLSLVGEFMSYDGTTQIAQVRNNVILKHRGEKLITDSLNFDRLNNYGYYFNGGKLIDNHNVLTSDWGEYYLGTRKTKFYYSVNLETPAYRITTDTLFYDLQTKWAEIYGPSNIYHDHDYIYTTKAYYNGKKDEYRISKSASKSIIYHNAIFRQDHLIGYESKLSGDSIVSQKDRETKVWGNAFYEDKKQKTILLGDYGEYLQKQGKALVTGRALVKYFENPSDTLFFHADTLKLFTFDIHTNQYPKEKTDSVYRVIHAYYHARSFRSDVQSVSDSLVYNTKTNVMTLYKDPILWNENRQVLGEEIEVFLNKSSLDSVYINRQALIVEKVDSNNFNQISADQIRSYFIKSQLVRNEADRNVRLVYYPQENGQNISTMWYMETSLLKMFLKDKKLTKLWAPSSQGTGYPLDMIPSDKKFLPNFEWFDYIRPQSKYDLFEWRSKKEGSQLKLHPRKEAPVQYLK